MSHIPSHLLTRVALTCTLAASTVVTGCALEPTCDSWQDCPVMETCSEDRQCVAIDVDDDMLPQTTGPLIIPGGANAAANPGNVTTSYASSGADTTLDAHFGSEDFDGEARATMMQDLSTGFTTVTVERITDDQIGFVIFGFDRQLDSEDLEPGEEFDSRTGRGVTVSATGCASDLDGPFSYDEPSSTVTGRVDEVDDDPGQRVMTVEFRGATHEGTAVFAYDVNL